MKFDEIIKKIRKDNKLTQEELSERLNVTRQAISNWETNKNLPDISILINISKIFNISLDELILGKKEIEEKLINDGSENKKVKMYTMSNISGFMLILLGFIFLLIKGSTFEYVDDSGILKENFFLIPTGFMLMLLGVITIIISIIYYYRKTNNKGYLSLLGCISLFFSIILLLLIYSNGNKISIIPIIFMIISILLIIYGKIKSK